MRTFVILPFVTDPKAWLAAGPGRYKTIEGMFIIESPPPVVRDGKRVCDDDPWSRWAADRHRLST